MENPCSKGQDNKNKDHSKKIKNFLYAPGNSCIKISKDLSIIFTIDCCHQQSKVIILRHLKLKKEHWPKHVSFKERNKTFDECRSTGQG